MINANEAKQMVTNYHVAIVNKIDDFMKNIYPKLLTLVMTNIDNQIKYESIHGRTSISYDVIRDHSISIPCVADKISKYISRKDNSQYGELKDKLTQLVVDTLVKYIENTFVKQGFCVRIWGKQDDSGKYVPDNLWVAIIWSVGR